MKLGNVRKLDRRITLVIPDQEIGRDDFNAPIIGERQFVVWASKLDIRDSERYAAQEVGAQVTTRFRIRWSTSVKGFDPRGSILFDGRRYDVSAVKEIGRRQGLEITANARAERV